MAQIFWHACAMFFCGLRLRMDELPFTSARRTKHNRIANTDSRQEARAGKQSRVNGQNARCGDIRSKQSVRVHSSVCVRFRSLALAFVCRTTGNAAGTTRLILFNKFEHIRTQHTQTIHVFVLVILHIRRLWRSTDEDVSAHVLIAPPSDCRALFSSCWPVAVVTEF